jgi:hypothetical protein
MIPLTSVTQGQWSPDRPRRFLRSGKGKRQGRHGDPRPAFALE